jgi:hypothetical protein
MFGIVLRGGAASGTVFQHRALDPFPWGPLGAMLGKAGWIIVGIANGGELWRARLSAGGQAAPMTYVARDGRQYVIVSAGGHVALNTRSGDNIMAFALPGQK